LSKPLRFSSISSRYELVSTLSFLLHTSPVRILFDCKSSPHYFSYGDFAVGICFHLTLSLIPLSPVSSPHSPLRSLLSLFLARFIRSQANSSSFPFFSVLLLSCAFFQMSFPLPSPFQPDESSFLSLLFSASPPLLSLLVLESTSRLGQSCLKLFSSNSPLFTFLCLSNLVPSSPHHLERLKTFLTFTMLTIFFPSSLSSLYC